MIVVLRYNTIFIVIDRLSKERYYIAYTASKEGTSAEAIARLLIKGVFRLYSLPDSIVLDRRLQFVVDIWKSFYRRLGINSKLLTVFYPKIDS